VQVVGAPQVGIPSKP